MSSTTSTANGQVNRIADVVPPTEAELNAQLAAVARQQSAEQDAAAAEKLARDKAGNVVLDANGNPVKGTKCRVSRQQFAANAKSIVVIIDGQTFEVDPMEFKTGSLGWNLNAKSTTDVGGEKCNVQIGLNVTLIGSKELPQ